MKIDYSKCVLYNVATDKRFLCQLLFRKPFTHESNIFPFKFLHVLKQPHALLAKRRNFELGTSSSPHPGNSPGTEKVQIYGMLMTFQIRVRVSFWNEFILSPYISLYLLTWYGDVRNFVPVQVLLERVHCTFQSKKNSRSGMTFHSGIV